MNYPFTRHQGEMITTAAADLDDYNVAATFVEVVASYLFLNPNPSDAEVADAIEHGRHCVGHVAGRASE